MAEVRFQMWPLMPGGPALGDLGRDSWSMTLVQTVAPTGLHEGLLESFQSHPIAFALSAMALLFILVVLVQSLAILAFGLDRLLGRLSPRTEKNGETSEGWPFRRWLRSLWSKPDDQGD